MSRLTPKQLETLSEPNVRALARAVFAEPLLELLERQSVSADSLQHRNSPLFPLDTARLNWLQALDQRPDTLLSHLSKSPSHRLGIYYERLWQFFLEQDPMVNPIAFNFAVRSGSQTLGEFDALFEHSERGLVHLELAVKFYLAKAAKPHTWASWFGPGKQDRLDLKLNRMLNRQAGALGSVYGDDVRPDLYPVGDAALCREIDELNGEIYTTINNGVAPALWSVASAQRGYIFGCAMLHYQAI